MTIMIGQEYDVCPVVIRVNFLDGTIQGLLDFGDGQFIHH